MTPFWIEDATLVATVAATLLPFVAFVLIVVLTRSRPRLSAALAIGASAISAGCALFLVGRHWHMTGPIQYLGRWLVTSSVEVPFGFMLDPVSLLMLVTAASISCIIQVYSLGYMAGDPGFSRYYAFMSLFAGAMLCLAVSPTMLQLYIFWELVGLSSYLLIGFWYEKFSASQAGKKAFVMTRTGDVALFLGILLVLLHFGNLNILEMGSPAMAASMPPRLVTLAALLIFGGIIGKSAQFPLMTWLPDAMEGPTPVSALLHSSTMVAAGVFLFERLFPLYQLSPTAMSVGLGVGTLSMLMASTMAMVSRDIKQILAYSTISQLGFMLMGLDAGDVFSGEFHLTTHAGFKALLFLCAGVLIHHYASNDIFELSNRGSRKLKVVMVCTVIGAGALAGLPPLSGFFSKELILAGLANLSNPIWLAAALLGVFLTAYYAFRMVFVLLFSRHLETTSGPADVGPHGGHDAGKERRLYWVMAWPLILLAGLTVLLGFLEHPLEHFLGYQLAAAGPMPGGRRYVWLPYAALVLAFGGVGLAWLEFGRRGASRVGFVERIAPLHQLFAERWYLDHLYRLLLDRVVDRGFSTWCYQNDNRVIDGSIDGMCQGTVEGGCFLARLHEGMIQYRLLVMLAVMVFWALYFFV